MLNIKKISIPLEISIYQVQQRNLSVQITLYTVFKLFVGIAYDSGGAAAGSLSASFVLPFIVSICEKLNNDGMLYGFGTIGIISIIPTIMIEVIGIRYQYILNKNKHKPQKIRNEISIIDFD